LVGDDEAVSMGNVMLFAGVAAGKGCEFAGWLLAIGCRGQRLHTIERYGLAVGLALDLAAAQQRAIPAAQKAASHPGVP